jgi:phosphoribosyl-ATP pyrophosphohydrolase
MLTRAMERKWQMKLENPSDTIDWQAVKSIDEWLDAYAGLKYQDQPLAQDWARLAKIMEEGGEAVQAFIGLTGQNPRKGVTHTSDDVLNELADVAFTAVFCMQHFTKNTDEVRRILRVKLAKIATRVPSLSGTVRPPDSEHGLHP